jgi:hypothetical protein
MLTTAMLTQLNELRRRQVDNDPNYGTGFQIANKVLVTDDHLQGCVFIIATNRIRSFDAAVTRPGEHLKC